MFVGKREILRSIDPPHTLCERTAKPTPAAWWEAAVTDDFPRLACIRDLSTRWLEHLTTLNIAEYR